MQLQSLKVNGFKSFAHQSELAFTTPITAIVGPNGSGKSNVAEAFRFVLGEQSVKSMRGKRGSDLLWGGSDAVARKGRASVCVSLDNRSRLLDLDFDEVRIERVVHRDGQNDYLLNGSAVRLRDIHELLAGAHIGPSGHHIISQGEADRVLTANARERREMVEDALGLKVFQTKKHEATKKLEKTLQNISETESLRREAAPHLRYLERQVADAERATTTQQELLAGYHEYLYREDTYVALRTNTLQAEQHTLQQSVRDSHDQVAALRAQKATYEEGVDRTPLEEAGRTQAAVEQVWQEAVAKANQLEGQVTYLRRSIEEREHAASQTVEAPTVVSRHLVDQVYNTARAQEPSAAAHQQLVSDLEAVLQADLPTTELYDSTSDKQQLETLKAALASAIEQVTQAFQAVETARHKVQQAQADIDAQQSAWHDTEQALFIALGREREQTVALRTVEAELATLERDRADFKQELYEATTLVGRNVMQYSQYGAQSDVSITEDEVLQEPRDSQRDRRTQLEKLKIRLEELGVGDTEALMLEFRQSKERDEFLSGELDDLHSSVDNLRTLIGELDTQIHTALQSGLAQIDREFNRFFTLMFGGGKAALDLVTPKPSDADAVDGDQSALQQSGIELHVSLPNKRVKGLEMLSGGERALTSIALVFAMSQVNPPPFIILDETDAALDEANSRRYGDMIEALAQKSQLILITHNRETMSRAGVLYGVTMAGDGVSQLLSIQFADATIHAK
jgi:chromosome segregation protein